MRRKYLQKRTRILKQPRLPVQSTIDSTIYSALLNGNLDRASALFRSRMMGLGLLNGLLAEATRLPSMQELGSVKKKRQKVKPKEAVAEVKSVVPVMTAEKTS